MLRNACAIGDNSTIIAETGFQQNDVMFGPPLPPPSWLTKVSTGTVLCTPLGKLFSISASSYYNMTWNLTKMPQFQNIGNKSTTQNLTILKILNQKKILLKMICNPGYSPFSSLLSSEMQRKEHENFGISMRQFLLSRSQFFKPCKLPNILTTGPFYLP